MKPGPKPLPSTVKRLTGRDRPYRRKSEPVAPDGAMRPTEQLSRLKFGMLYWNMVIAAAPVGMLRPIDCTMVESLCQALALKHAAMDRVIELGPIIMIGEERDANGTVTRPGTMAHNPYLTVVRQQAEAARKFSAELGLVVTARARLDFPDLPPPPEADGPRMSFKQFVRSNPQYRRPPE